MSSDTLFYSHHLFGINSATVQKPTYYISSSSTNGYYICLSVNLSILVHLKLNLYVYHANMQLKFD